MATGTEPAGYGTVRAEWFGDSFLPLLKPSEVLALLYLLTRCQGRREAWSVPAEEVAAACHLGRESALGALKTVRSLGFFECYQSRDHDGSPRWYYILKSDEDRDPNALSAFVEVRRARAASITAKRSECARQLRPSGSGIFLSPSQVQPDVDPSPPSQVLSDPAQSGATSPGLVRCRLISQSGATSLIGRLDNVVEDIKEKPRSGIATVEPEGGDPGQVEPSGSPSSEAKPDAREKILGRIRSHWASDKRGWHEVGFIELKEFFPDESDDRLKELAAEYWREVAGEEPDQTPEQEQEWSRFMESCRSGLHRKASP